MAGGSRLTTVSKTGNFTVIFEDVVRVDATAGAVAITLPTITMKDIGQMVWVKKVDASANAVTVTRGGADLIDGAATAVLAGQYDAVILVVTAAAEWSIFQFGSP